MIPSTDCSTDYDQQQYQLAMEALNSYSPCETVPNTPQQSPFYGNYPPNHPAVQQFSPEEQLAAYWNYINWNAAAVASAHYMTNPYAYYPNYGSSVASPVYPAPQAQPGKQQPRGRVPYSVEQVAMLKARFKQSDSIHIEERREMAKVIGLDEKQIKIWFQNRRFHMRKDKLKKEKDGKESSLG